MGIGERARKDAEVLCRLWTRWRSLPRSRGDNDFAVGEGYFEQADRRGIGRGVVEDEPFQAGEPGVGFEKFVGDPFFVVSCKNHCTRMVFSNREAVAT